MRLTKDNINEWLKELNKRAEQHFGKDFSETLTKKEWLDEWEGETAKECISANICEECN